MAEAAMCGAVAQWLRERCSELPSPSSLPVRVLLVVASAAHADAATSVVAELMAMGNAVHVDLVGSFVPPIPTLRLTLHAWPWLLDASVARPRDVDLALLLLLLHGCGSDDQAHAALVAASSRCRPGGAVVLAQQEHGASAGLPALRSLASDALHRQEWQQRGAAAPPPPPVDCGGGDGEGGRAGRVPKRRRQGESQGGTSVSPSTTLAPPDLAAAVAACAGVPQEHIAAQTRTLSASVVCIAGGEEAGRGAGPTGHPSCGDDDIAALGAALCMDLSPLERDPLVCAHLRRMMRAHSLCNVLPRAVAVPPGGRSAADASDALVCRASYVTTGKTTAVPRPTRILLHVPVRLTCARVPGGEGAPLLCAPPPLVARLVSRGHTPLRAHSVGGHGDNASDWALYDGQHFNHGLALWQQLRCAWSLRPAGYTHPRRLRAAAARRAAAALARSSAACAPPPAGEGDTWWGLLKYVGSGGGMWAEEEVAAPSPRHSAAQEEEEEEVGDEAQEGGEDEESGGHDSEKEEEEEEEEEEEDFDHVLEALVADGPNGIAGAPPLSRPLPLRVVVDLFEDAWDTSWVDFEEEETEREAKDEGWG